MKNKVILVASGGGGKDYLATYLIYKEFRKNISYTTRPPRKGEIEGKDYYFITPEDFEQKISEFFWEEYNIFIPEKRWYYGTSKQGYIDSNLLIKEPKGVSQLSKSQRDECFIIYLNISEDIRRERLLARKRMEDNVERRLEADRENFKDFIDYDIMVSRADFDPKEIYGIILDSMNYTSDKD